MGFQDHRDEELAAQGVDIRPRRDRKNDGLKGHLQDEYNMAKVKKHVPPGNVT